MPKIKISKKLTAIAITFLTIILNRKIGLDLNPDDVVAVVSTGLGYAGLQSIVDAVKAYRDK